MNKTESDATLRTQEKELLDEFNEGSYTAYTTIYNKYWDEFYGYALRLVRAETMAQDILQDVFVDLWELRGKLQHIDTLKAYIFSMVRNRTLRILYLENRIPREQIDVLEEQLRESSWNSLDTLIAKELEDEVYAIVKTMPYRMQKTFIKSRYDGYSHKEISEEMGVSDQTVKKQIQHSLRLIRARLSRIYMLFL